MERDYFEQFINKRVKIIFDDGEKINRKEGTLTGFNDSFLFFDTTENKEAILITKIVRIEFLGGFDDGD